MLDWLKTILGEAYTETIDRKVAEEIGKGFVARADFNNLNTEKKRLEGAVTERDGQLEALRASSGDVEALKTQIAALQADNAKAAKEHEAELRRLRLDTAVEAALAGANAKNSRAVKALLDLEKAELAEDGSVKGLAEQLKKLREAPDSAFLFEAGKKQPALQGFKPLEGSDPGPGGAGKAPAQMSYDELCAFLAANPGATLA